MMRCVGPQACAGSREMESELSGPRLAAATGSGSNDTETLCPIVNEP